MGHGCRCSQRRRVRGGPHAAARLAGACGGAGDACGCVYVLFLFYMPVFACVYVRVCGGLGGREGAEQGRGRASARLLALRRAPLLCRWPCCHLASPHPARHARLLLQPSENCSAYFPAALDGAYTAPDLGAVSGGGGGAASETGESVADVATGVGETATAVGVGQTGEGETDGSTDGSGTGLDAPLDGPASTGQASNVETGGGAPGDTALAQPEDAPLAVPEAAASPEPSRGEGAGPSRAPSEQAGRNSPAQRLACRRRKFAGQAGSRGSAGSPACCQSAGRRLLPRCRSPGAGDAQGTAPAAGWAQEPQWGDLNPGSATVGTGAAFLQALASGVGNITLSGAPPLAFPLAVWKGGGPGWCAAVAACCRIRCLPCRRACPHLPRRPIRLPAVPASLFSPATHRSSRLPAWPALSPCAVPRPASPRAAFPLLQATSLLPRATSTFKSTRFPSMCRARCGCARVRRVGGKSGCCGGWCMVALRGRDGTPACFQLLPAGMPLSAPPTTCLPPTLNCCSRPVVPGGAGLEQRVWADQRV